MVLCDIVFPFPYQLLVSGSDFFVRTRRYETVAIYIPAINNYEIALTYFKINSVYTNL